MSTLPPKATLFASFLSFNLEQLLPMTTDEDAEILVLMREAMEKSRGYASYWEWKPDKRRPELQAAKVLARFLWPGQDYSISSITNDPPDALVQLETQRYGIEVSEIVDQKAVERASKRKKQDLPVEYDWANWNSDRLYEALEQGLVTKDRKLVAHAQNYDELLLAFVTDEGMIDSRLAAAVAGRIHSDTRYIDRAFIILSYEPNADELTFPDRCPIFELEIKQSDAA
jgi:hypothetical protein